MLPIRTLYASNYDLHATLSLDFEGLLRVRNAASLFFHRRSLTPEGDRV